ncbi:BREX-1 system adenine-specific DNA-methyltransferase PglX [Spirosoma flavum]|uniref:site-specific DNA-methyltransferase (adenine-specific) n=1 Tax=Spirosoma flavum TaxID=2048557 RepID=A0ABW6AP19_9BACT
MNTNALKKFATAARRKLITQVTAKLSYVLGSDSPALREQADALRQLRDELTRTPKNDLIERVAYTWFNRFVALRFLDANDYQPTGIRAVSPSDGFTTPQLLDEAKNGQIDESLPVDTRRVMDLLDGRLPSRDPQNEVYQLLLIATCNALNSALPFLFEPLADYTELLMPDDLLSPQSVLGDIREGMTIEDCQHVEVIGWLYQFYISERKDAVFAAKSKVKAEDIPAATQLFTPRWVVEYMVQNTVGKLWLRNHPSSSLREKMPYYLESPSETTDAFLPIARPQDISLLDPAAGSGHILVYGFELLVHIYEEEGYSRTEIPALILQHNLTGFDIDERAAQLAAFALSMKARQYDRRFLKRGTLPRVVSLHKLTHTNEADWRSLLNEVGCQFLDTLVRDLTSMTQADNLGALIRPETPLDSLQTAADVLTTYARQSTDLFRKPLAEDLVLSLQHLALLAQKHTCVAANPPYMGGGAMNGSLSTFVKSRYPDSKADLMACFMESALSQCQENGYVGMINQHSWMFLSSYEGLRKKLIDGILIDTLLHLGPRTFPEIGGEVVQNVAFTLQNQTYNEPPAGHYVRLVDFKNTFEKAAGITNTVLTHYIQQNNFKKIPGEPIAYWLSKEAVRLFSGQKVGDVMKPSVGMFTTNNELFLRFWFEISFNRVGFGFISKQDAFNSSFEWFPYMKGGGYKKWYGNISTVIHYKDKGAVLRDLVNNKYPYLKGNTDFVLKESNPYFSSGITWSDVSTNDFSCRYLPHGFMYDVKGTSAFPSQNIFNKVFTFLNSKVASTFLYALNPTMSYQIGNIRALPFDFERRDENTSKIDEFSRNNIQIAKCDWDARETSWDFETSELLRHRTDGLLANAVQAYEVHWQGRFMQLHQNEEALNRIFIDLYGLQDELTPEVDPTDITILGQEAKPDSVGKLTFDRKELMAQFVSYAVGCMFGRYSLDKTGLILASQGQTLADYEQLIADATPGLAPHAPDSFRPDADNIIPVLDEDWFSDDIVARFKAFLRASFGDGDYNQNLAFVEDSLGIDLRKWFTKYFYDDHIRRYRRRPIYWLFQSPKGSFRALIYLHRYAPDTVARLLNGYLREYQEKLRNQRQQQLSTSLSATATAGEKTRAQKEADRLERVLVELAQYERDIIYPLATEPITMDLDDGVLVNYNRFGAALAPAKGLTGKAGGSEDE